MVRLIVARLLYQMPSNELSAMEEAVTGRESSVKASLS